MSNKVLSGGSSSSSTTGTPDFRKAIQGDLLGLFDPKTQSASLDKFAQPGTVQAATEGFGKIAGGSQFDMNNPFVQNMLSTLGQQSQQDLGQTQANIRSRYALAGQPSTGTSSPLLNAQEQAGVLSNKNLQATEAGNLFNMYGQGMTNQLEGLRGLLTAGLTPAQLMQSLAPILSKSKSSSQGSLLGSIGQLLGGVGGAAGGAAALAA